MFELASKALSKHLITLLDPTLVSPQNGDFVPTAGQTYYTERTMPVGRYGLTMSGAKQAQSYMYEVTVNVPAKTNKFTAFNEADEVSRHFYRGLVLTEGDLKLEIYQTEIATPRETDTWFTVPVLVYTRFYA